MEQHFPGARPFEIGQCDARNRSCIACSHFEDPSVESHTCVREAEFSDMTAIFFLECILKQHWRASLQAEEVNSLFELVSCNKQRRILVCPIEAGREILQEAPVNTLEILLRAIHAAQTQPCIAPFSGTRYPRDAVEIQQGVMDIISGCSDQRRELPCNLPVEPDTTKSEVFCVDVSSQQSKYIAGTPDKRDSVANELTGAIEALAAPPERPPVGVTKKSRREREFDVRKERASERKAKSERVKRRQELDRLKKLQQQEAENWAQQRECVYMQQEDDRSAAVVRHARRVQLSLSLYRADVPGIT